MAKKKQEKKLWCKVKHSLEKHYGYICSNDHSKRKKLKQDGFVNIGLGGVIADVIGIKDIGNKYEPQIEVIAVEVKENYPNYRLRHMDQVRRAADFAHKVFLAAPREFTPEEVELAVEERIGLFELDPQKMKLKLIVPSPSFRPSESKIIELMRRLEFFKCSVCNCYWNKNLINIDGYRPTHVFSGDKKIKFIKFVCEKCSDKLYDLHFRDLTKRFAEEWKFKRLGKKLESLKSKSGKLAVKGDVLKIKSGMAKQGERIKRVKADIRASFNKKLKQINEKLGRVRKSLRAI